MGFMVIGAIIGTYLIQFLKFLTSTMTFALGCLKGTIRPLTRENNSEKFVV